METSPVQLTKTRNRSKWIMMWGQRGGRCGLMMTNPIDRSERVFVDDVDLDQEC